jgi:transcriptional regulator with XRE-family HTH domain
VLLLLGPKIREIRQEKGLTLNELADKTKLTASYLSQIERNIIDPSISSLRKISVELGVPIYTFLTDEKKQNVLIHAEKRKKLELPNSSIIYEFVTPMASDKEVNSKMEIIYFQLDPCSWSNDELMIHPADECIFIIEGTVELYLAEDKYTLNKGDSIYIQENIPHRFYNPTSEKVIGISSICPPIY